MCGICGVVDFDEGRDDRGLLRRMADVIEHRGPDGEGFYWNPRASNPGEADHGSGARVGLAARRLAIIDVAAGQQPLSNEDGSVWVTYNGEIYNFLVLRDELSSKGHVFRTRCDTEVIVHAYEEWGDECVTRFNGMFAFAVWDEKRQRLLLARDRMGVKPLVYHQRGRRLVFGSEIKSLLQDSEIERTVDCDVLLQYLSFCAVPEPASLFRGVRRLPAGHVLVFENGETRLRKYWDIDFSRPDSRGEGAWLSALETLLEDAVRIRLVSEVPLGAFLSGGIDSGLIVAMMARGSGTIRTSTVSFAPGYSEAEPARLVADAFGTDHQERVFEQGDAWRALPTMVWHHDEPSQSLIQGYFVSKAARDRVTVALSGLGGDELFTGYPSHVAAQRFHYAERIPQAFRGGLRSLLAAWKGGGASRFLEASLMPPELRFASRYLQATTEADRASIVSTELGQRANAEGATEYLLRLFADANAEDFRGRLLYVDQKAYLANELLRTTDSMSMAHSLEVRTPFLDYRMVELAARMPMRMKMRGFTTKYAIRRLAERHLSKATSRRPKTGFNAPLRNWIDRGSEAFVRDHLTSEVVKRRGYFRAEQVERMLDDHFAGRRDRSQWILMLLTLELWHGLFIDRAPSRVERSGAAAAL